MLVPVITWPISCLIYKNFYSFQSSQHGFPVKKNWIQRTVTESTFIQAGVGGTHVDVSAKESTMLIPLEPDETTLRKVRLVIFIRMVGNQCLTNTKSPCLHICYIFWRVWRLCVCTLASLYLHTVQYISWC